jgi:hypothetical protein
MTNDQLLMTKKRLFISTGEVSGDLQGALLIDALKRQAEVIGVELEIVGARWFSHGEGGGDAIR